MHRGPLAAVTRHCTVPRRSLHFRHTCSRAFASIVHYSTPSHCPVPHRHRPRLIVRMRAAFSTFDKQSNDGATNGGKNYSAAPLTPPAPLSPDDREAAVASATAPASPSPTSSSLLPSNTAGGSSSSFLHSLASRLQGRRGEMAGRALSAPADHSISSSSAPVLSPSAGFDLSKLQQPSLVPPRPAVVLLACGSYSPVTSMHLLLFETAKNYLMYETAALDVVGGIVSPVHDNYGKPSLVAAQHRINMTRAATASSTWITTSAWETLQSGWTTTCATMAAYSSFIAASSLYPSPPRLVLLCGADLLESTQVAGLWAAEDLEVIFGEYGVAVIERVGLDLELLIASDERLRRWREHIWIVPQRVVNNVSSTVVRAMIRDGLSIEYLVEAKVREYIYQHALFGHDKDRERRRRQRPVAMPLLHDAEKVLEGDEGEEADEERGMGQEEDSEAASRRMNDTNGLPVLPPAVEPAQRSKQT